MSSDKYATPSSHFSEAVRAAVEKANEEANRLQHDYIGTEHLLLGALQDATVATILHRLGVAPEQLRSVVQSRVRHGKARPATGPLPYTSVAKRVLKHALDEARNTGQQFIRSEHLLLALLSSEPSIATDVLRQAGATPKEVMSASVSLPGDNSRSFHFEIDESSGRSIHDQIVGQVTEAIATGKLSPAERLPSVRELADLLDVAPGTVARAYGELERQGIVITEGPRGTRVAERSTTAARPEHLDVLAGLLRPVAVAAFHLGAGPTDLRAALEEAMRGIFDRQYHAA